MDNSKAKFHLLCHQSIAKKLVFNFPYQCSNKFVYSFVYTHLYTLNKYLMNVCMDGMRVEFLKI